MSTPLTRTLYCLDCTAEIEALPQQQRESGALRAICTRCLNRRTKRADHTLEYKTEKAREERQRAERFAKRQQSERQARREVEAFEGYIPEGAVIPWI